MATSVLRGVQGECDLSKETKHVHVGWCDGALESTREAGLDRAGEQRSWHRGGVGALNRRGLDDRDVAGGTHGKEWHLHEEREM